MSMTNPDDDWMATNVHESCHAITFEAHGVDVDKLKAWRMFGASEGRAHVKPPKEAEVTNDWLAGFLIGLVGGSEGEAHYWRLFHGYSMEEARNRTRVGSSFDLKNFARYTHYLDIPLTEAEARELASEAILPHWHAITVLSARLVRARQLPGRAVGQAHRDADSADLYDLLREE